MNAMRERLMSAALSIGGLVAALSSFQAGAAVPGDLSASDRAELLRASGITCAAGASDGCVAGNPDSGDYYDVSLYADCAVAPYYGRIEGAPVPLRTRAAATGSGGKVAGALPPHQLVCIRAAAKVKQTDMEYFVMALPSDPTARCRPGKSCRKPALSAQYDAAMRNCAKGRSGAYAGCPQGWVFAKDIEPYPNGL